MEVIAAGPTLSWTTSGASVVWIVEDTVPVPLPIPAPSQAAKGQMSAATAINSSSQPSVTYTLYAYGPGGQTSATLNVGLPPIPECDFTLTFGSSAYVANLVGPSSTISVSGSQILTFGWGASNKTSSVTSYYTVDSDPTQVPWIVYTLYGQAKLQPNDPYSVYPDPFQSGHTYHIYVQAQNAYGSTLVGFTLIVGN